MNELLKYATFSIDLTGKPVKVNRMFSLGRARIFYKGPNPNRSIIDGEVANKLASTIPGTPIIGLYDYDKEDFEGHGVGQAAYGFVPLDPNPTWETVNEDGKEREYLEVDVVIWDGRFEEAKDIIKEEKSLSMELNPATLKGTMEQFNNHTYYRITNAEFGGITVLGDDVEPCFKSAGFLNAYSAMVSAYANFMENIHNNEEGGISQMEDINEIQVDEIVETEVAEEVVETEEVAEVETVELPEEEVVEEAAAEEVVVEEATEIPAEETPAEDEKPHYNRNTRVIEIKPNNRSKIKFEDLLTLDDEPILDTVVFWGLCIWNKSDGFITDLCLLFWFIFLIISHRFIFYLSVFIFLLCFFIDFFVFIRVN